MLILSIEYQSHDSINTLPQSRNDFPNYLRSILHLMLVLLQLSYLLIIKLVANYRVTSHFCHQKHCFLNLGVQLLLWFYEFIFHPFLCLCIFSNKILACQLETLSSSLDFSNTLPYLVQLFSHVSQSLTWQRSWRMIARWSEFSWRNNILNFQSDILLDFINCPSDFVFDVALGLCQIFSSLKLKFSQFCVDLFYCGSV